MPAIITDQYRILNAETFVDSFVGIGTTGKNNYYTFIGHPKPGNITYDIGYGNIRWETEPPNPIDNFNQENRYHDSMLFLKKIIDVFFFFKFISIIILFKNWIYNIFFVKNFQVINI